MTRRTSTATTTPTASRRCSPRSWRSRGRRGVRCDSPIRRCGEALRGKGIASTDRFDDSFFDQAATRETLLTILGALPSGTTELMCHPAFVDEELRATSSYAVPRARELEVLTSEVVREAVHAAQIDLISFASL